MEKKNYNPDLDPVYYCVNCHSLHILVDKGAAFDEWDGSYCAKCKSTNIGKESIQEWLREQEALDNAHRIRELKTGR